MTSVAIIGGGNMGEALIKGLYKTHRIIVCESNAARVQYLKKKYKTSSDQIAGAVKNASIIVLAVKPQDMPDVLQQMQADGTDKKLVISIAAGLTTRFFESAFPKHKIAVVRCMPNMPALIGEGITGLCAGKYAGASHIKTAQRILSSIGETFILKESMIDAVTAVSGSGPAYVFAFVEQWMNAAVRLGFTQAQAKQLVYKTLLGSAHLLQSSSFDAGTLREKVTSKGGTTQAALEVFKSNKFDAMMIDALKAANRRAKELAK